MAGNSKKGNKGSIKTIKYKPMDYSWFGWVSIVIVYIPFLYLSSNTFEAARSGHFIAYYFHFPARIYDGLLPGGSPITNSLQSILIFVTASFYAIPIAYLLHKKLFKSFYTYQVCPNCDGSFKFIDNWVCDHCKQPQGKDRPICDKCVHCKRKLETVFCEHCHQEMRL